MKLDELLSALNESLNANGVAKPVIAKVMKDLQQAAEEEKADKGPKVPRAKGQVAILLQDASGSLKALNTTLTGYALTIEESASPAVVLDRIKAAALSFNRTKAGLRNPVTTLWETLEVVKGKHWKDEAHPEVKTKVLNREPVEVIPVGAKL